MSLRYSSRAARLTTTAATLALLLVAGQACADSASSITIINSGSTNSSRYTINVMPNGSATYDDGNSTKQVVLDSGLTQKLFMDVQLALPFVQMELGHCAKSASFGTKTTVTYNGDLSPDISCAGDSKSTEIYQDVLNVKKALGVGYVPRHRPPM